MSFLAWIILGLIAGFIGSKLVNNRGEGLILDVLLGIVGAVVGGWLFNRFGAAGVTGLNLYSLLVAVIGAVVVLVVALTTHSDGHSSTNSAASSAPVHPGGIRLSGGLISLPRVVRSGSQEPELPPAPRRARRIGW